MKAKRPMPPECPVCTSREVTRGWSNSGITFIENIALPGAGMKRMPKPPKPKVIRYRCMQCGHKFEMPNS